MPQMTGVSLYRRRQNESEKARMRERVATSAMQDAQIRNQHLEDLLRQASEWVYPYDERRICQFCQSSMEEPHDLGCSYYRWLSEVRDLIGR